MLFNSLQFLIFFPIVVLIYFAIPNKIKYLWLLAASYYFYMCWNAKYALLLLFSTAVTYLSGLGIHYIAKTDWEEKKAAFWKKACVFGSVFLNLAILMFFKYFNFGMTTLNKLFAMVHIELNAPILDIALPVGISFFIFNL